MTAHSLTQVNSPAAVPRYPYREPAFRLKGTAMFDILSRALERRRRHREVDAIDERGLDELGLSRGELHTLVDAPATVIARLSEMAFRHGLDDAKLARSAHDYAQMVDACEHCAATRECRSFLSDPAADVAAAGFCPNRAVYRELAGAGPA